MADELNIIDSVVLSTDAVERWKCLCKDVVSRLDNEDIRKPVGVEKAYEQPDGSLFIQCAFCGGDLCQRVEAGHWGRAN